MSFTTRRTVLERVKLGSQVGWQEFEAIYRPLIHLRGNDRGLRPDELSDLVQQVLLNLFQKKTVWNYDSEKGRFRDYLKVIIDRRAYDLLRKRKGFFTSFENMQEADLESDDFNGMEKRWDNEWHNHMIAQAIEMTRPEVSPMIYEAFCMTVLDNIKGEDVAKTLGISLESVYVAKHRFQKKMRPLLKRLEDDE